MTRTLRLFITVIIIVIVCLLLVVALPSWAESLFGPADSSWPMYQHDVMHTGRSQYTGIVHHPLTLWKKQLPSLSGEDGGMSLGTDGTIYVAAGNQLMAFDPSSQTVKWTFEYRDNNRSVPTTRQNGTILWGFGDTFAAVTVSGTLDWAAGGLSANYVFASSPAIDSNNNLYFTHDGMWSFTSDGQFRWAYRYSWFAHSSPAIGPDGTVYGSGDHGLYAYSPDGSSRRFITTTVDTYDSSPAISSDGTLYVPTYNARLAALDLTGTLKWEFRTDESLIQWHTTLNNGIAIGTDGTVYFSVFNPGYSIDHINVYAVNPDGSLKWKFPIPSRKVANYDGNPNVYAPIVVDKMNHIYVCAHNSSCYALSQEGSLLWEYFFPPIDNIVDWVDTAPIIAADGVMYILDGHRILYALAEPTQFVYLPAINK